MDGLRGARRGAGAGPALSPSWKTKSTVALSVSTSPITSPDESLSPSFFVHRAILPAVIVGLSAGIVTTDDAARERSGRAAAEAARARASIVARLQAERPPVELLSMRHTSLTVPRVAASREDGR